MITATSNPRIWRIEIESNPNDYTKTGLVCYLHDLGTGIQLYYSHHVMYARQIPKGPWQATTVLQQPLDAVLKSTVLIGVMPAVWESGVIPDIKRWPLTPDRPVSEAPFGD